MKILRLSSLALAAALMLPVTSQAQVTLHLDGVKYAGGDRVNNDLTGPYVAHQTLPSMGAAFDIYCIDMDHSAQTKWPATYLTFEQATSGGLNGAAANRQLGTEKSWGIAQLRAAAYLSTQFGLVGPGANDDNFDDVHGAIWSMFSTNSALTQSMKDMADMAVANHGGETSWDANYLFIMDTRAYDNTFAVNSLNQGFIVNDTDLGIRVVPEPSTYALMGAGLFAIAFVRRRRRSV